MKKLLLSAAVLAGSLSAVFAQSTVTGFTYNFNTTGTVAGVGNNCIISCCQYSGMVRNVGDGTSVNDVTKGTDLSLQIKSTATATSNNTGSQLSNGYGQGPLVLDIYRTLGSGLSASCSKLDDSNTLTGGFINMGANKKVKITAKASSPMRLRLELGRAFVAATNADNNVFEMDLTTSYQEFTYDYSGKFGTFDSTRVSTLRFKFNVGDANVSSTTGFNGTVNISSIKLGSDANATTTTPGGGTSTSTGFAEDEYYASQVSVFPNPATENVTIDLSSVANSATVKLVNMSGAVVAEQASFGTTTFPVSGLTKGLYFIQISTEARVIRKKVMIE